MAEDAVSATELNHGNGGEKPISNKVYKTTEARRRYQRRYYRKHRTEILERQRQGDAWWWKAVRKAQGA